MKKLRLAGIGCGGRTRTYLGLATKYPHRFEVVAAADPNPRRLEMVRELSGNPAFRGFADDKALLAQERLADILVIGTQDSYHVEPCLAAMEKGYDILLEKPISPQPQEVVRLEETARRLGRRVMVCHVLRYTPFYEKVKALVASGHIGEVASIHASEGVGAWHQAHSFVRGHWAVREKSSPMILAKSCHDLDILSWLVDRQVLALDFEGGTTATFAMTAFDGGRNIEIMGTRGVLRGGHFVRRALGCDIVVYGLDSNGEERFYLPELKGGYDGHGGGDAGLVAQLYHEMAVVAPEHMKSSLARSVESHLIAFAAEESRMQGSAVSLAEYRQKLCG